MDRRTLLALVLVAIVVVGTPMVFHGPRPVARPMDSATADSVAAHDLHAVPNGASSVVHPDTARAAMAPPSTAPANTVAPTAPSAHRTQTAATDSTILSTSVAKYTIVSPGAVPSRVTLPGDEDLRPGHTGPVVIAQPDGPLLHFRLALGADTIAFDTIAFSAKPAASGLELTSGSPAITVRYEPSRDGYVMRVSGTVATAPAGSSLLIDLPNALRSSEADTLDDLRHLAYVYHAPHRDVISIPFSKLDSTSVRTDTSSLQWVSARSKYWLVALMKPIGSDTGAVFRGIAMRGGTRVSRVTRNASAVTSEPLVNGSFAFDLYVGPQSFARLLKFGNGLENVDQYAGLLHPVVQPFATIMLRVLLWMKSTLNLSYGWVLVIFGIAIRILLWPLYQKSMHTSIQMQRLQPELSEVQKKYKTEPEKQREALMKIYQAHGMSPLSPMLGCLPMLLPMPLLYALYFVLQNTIEFRGVPFLWLPDLSLRDPYYIIPLVMGASMFVLSWMGLRAGPSNPQAKMMSYMMPVLFTVMFLNFASGLNLYYAVQNIAALPQQWTLSRARAKAGLPPPSLMGAGKKT
jgi:YidC/Oxa1 family membrane protein insertase